MNSSSAKTLAVLSSVIAVGGACVVMSLQQTVAALYVRSSALLVARSQSQLNLRSGMDIRVSSADDADRSITRLQLPTEIPPDVEDASEYLRGYAAAVSFQRSTAVP